MGLQIVDHLSPGLARLAARCRNRKPVLEAMGLEFESITVRAFTNPALRPLPWRDKVDGTPATLRKSGAMWQSVKRPPVVTENSVTCGSDRAYAAIHQLGGKTGRNHAATMPPRPFFPILNGKLTPEAKRLIEAVGHAKIKILLK